VRALLTSPVRCLLLLLAFSSVVPAALSQVPRKADSVRAKVDTTAVVPDSVSAAQSSSGIDSVVVYSAADSIVYALSRRTMYLYGKSSIKYKELGLKAEAIDINWNTSILNARGVADTADTTGKKFRGLPELIDGNENYDGSVIAYNFKSKKGKIDLGKTEIEKGLYYGEAIKKVESDVLFVAEGKFTSCDLEHPHYYFGSPEMKVVLKDKIVARPVYLYISDVPVFALPFGVFPSERGRRSGLLAPAYGQSNRGRYLTHLGYYWATNDYMDVNVRGDIYSKGSYTLYSDFRYALRYLFTGSISGSYGRSVLGEPGDPDYGDSRVFNIHLGHNQDFNPTTRLIVDFTFTSGSYYQQTSNNYNDLLRQNVVSNATLTKYWEGTPNSMTINIRRDQNLRADTGMVEISEALPAINFSRSQSFPFRASKSGVGEQRWYELVGYSYGGQFLNSRTTTKHSYGSDLDERHGITQTVSVNASPKLGYFTITPFFNLTEKWYDKSIVRTFNPADSTVAVQDVRGFKAVHVYDFGISASTKLYGILQPGILGIKGIRHQIIPSINYTYQPDFSKPQFGYYGSYVDQAGNIQRYSYFEREVFGGAPAGERQAIGFNVGNVFEMKTAADDTSGKENKFTLLNLNAGISYNFAADSLKFSELGLSFRTNIGELFSIGGSTSFNLYQFAQNPRDPLSGQRINKFLLEEGKLADMTNFNISVGTRLSGEKKKTTSGPTRSPADTLGQRMRSGYVGLFDQEAPDFSIPWNLDLTWNFSQSQPNPAYKLRSSNLSAGLGFNLTEFWKVTASASYDVINQQFAAPQITVYRDLHCWEMSFYWVPTGPYRNFRIEIRLKAQQLQDIKVTKQGSIRDIY